MLVDANLLIDAVHEDAARHDAAREWLRDQLNGPRRVGVPWQSLGAFLRIATHPRLLTRPLTPSLAWQRVTDWLAAPAAWIPVPGPGHAAILGDLITGHGLSGNLIPDAQLAALAIEHGLTLCSADSDFARFPAVSWVDPLRDA